MFVVFKGGVGFAAIEIGVDEKVMGDNICGNPSLGYEAVEGEEVGIAGLTEEGGKDAVHSENGGTAVGVDGVTSEKRSFIQIVDADEAKDAIVEIEAVTGQSRDGFRDLWGVRVRVLAGLGLLGLLLVAE